MKKTLITGITGQDGAHLSEFLLGRGCEVYEVLYSIGCRSPPGFPKE
ncbi:MAG: GDP-mannose 4,6-dehydratase [Nitrospira sp.]|nr:GDP-mannose 4,6-dehydratase [Nitrospira sp.]